MADTGNNKSASPRVQHQAKRNDSHTRKENAKGSKPTIPQQRKPSSPAISQTASPPPPPQNPWKNRAAPSKQSSSEAAKLAVTKEKSTIAATKQKATTPQETSSSKTKAATSASTKENSSNMAPVDLDSLMASQSVPGFNADEVMRAWREEYKQTMAQLGENVMLKVDSKTADKELERKPGIMANGLHFYEELARQLAELEDKPPNKVKDEDTYS